MVNQLPSALGHVASNVAALGPAEMPAGSFKAVARGQHMPRPGPGPGRGGSFSTARPRAASSMRHLELELPSKPRETVPGGTAALATESSGSTLLGVSRLRGRGGLGGGGGSGLVRAQPLGSSANLLPGSTPIIDSCRLWSGNRSFSAFPAEISPPLSYTKSGHLRTGRKPEHALVVRAAKGAPSKPAGAPSDFTASPGGNIRKGTLLEFERDGSRTTLAVAQRPDGKAKWITVDQHGSSFSIKPQQVIYVVPGSQEYNPAAITTFLQEVDAMEDSSLLEIAWSEMAAAGHSIGADELAEMLFLSSGPIECYCAHRMLTNDKVYFKRRKGNPLVFEPRPAAQVEELQVKVAAEEAVERERRHFVDSMRSVLLKPRGERVPLASWQQDPLIGPRLAAIRAYALELPALDTKLAEESLEALGVTRQPTSATDLLLRLGVLPRHLNVEFLRSDVPQEFPPDVLAAAQAIVDDPPPDLDEALRVDLTHLKVFTIDSEDTTEIDDGLSVERRADGKLYLWVHVADPARWVRPQDVLDMEAKRRGTSVYLCTGMLPMFPLALAAGPMSLRQGRRCCAMSVGMELRADGSLAESQIVNSYIEPTYRLNYEDVEEMMSMAAEEEPELRLLAQMASLRREYRMGQGAVEISMPETELKILDPDSDDPEISLCVKDQSTPARQLVAEMMILAGEALARFGGDRGLPLPYRGQAEPDFPDPWELESIPAGPCTAVVLRRCMTRSETNCGGPIPHASLGLPGYVQFTSPIRRYGDMLAHYQVKATLRGEPLPFGAPALEAAMGPVGLRIRESRRQETAAARYWLLEYLRRQPRGTPMQALILRFVRETDDTLIGILIHELGYETVMRVTRNVRIGESIEVVVVEADPRKDVLRIQEADLFERISSAAAAATSLFNAASLNMTESSTEQVALRPDTVSANGSEHALNSTAATPNSVVTTLGDVTDKNDVADVRGDDVLSSSGEETQALPSAAPAVSDMEERSNSDVSSMGEEGEASLEEASSRDGGSKKTSGETSKHTLESNGAVPHDEHHGIDSQDLPGRRDGVGREAAG